MREYSYIATGKDGTEYKGTRKANSTDEIVDYLHQNNLIVVSINESVGIDFKKLAELQLGGMPLKDKMIITKQLTTMLGAGVPMVQALEVVVSQAKNRNVKSDLQRVLENVKGGVSLSSAFKKHSKIYDELQVNLLDAGEKSGNLVEVLKQIALDLEKRTQLFSKVRGALIYPAIIFFVIGIVMVVMTVFMIPAVEDLYADFGIDELPFITQSFVDLSNIITNPVGALIFIILIFGTLIGFRSYYASIGGRKVIDKFLLKAPVFGSIVEYSQVVQLTRLLSMLIRSGLPIIDSLTTVSNALGNIHYKEAIKQAVVDISKGTPLAVTLAKTEVVPPMLVRMIAIGEDTGSLDQMLDDMSKYYESELNDLTDNLTKLMEPFILLIVGGIVALLAVAIYLPIYSISQV